MKDARFEFMDNESWLIARLGQHGVRIEDGPTSYEIRRERIRDAIRDNHLEPVICAKSNGKTLTYLAAFERLYQQPFKRKEQAA